MHASEVERDLQDSRGCHELKPGPHGLPEGELGMSLSLQALPRTSGPLGCFSSYTNTMLITANPSSVSQGSTLRLLAHGQESRIWVTHQHQLPFLR